MEINNRRVSVRSKGHDGPVFYWATFLHREDEIEHMWELLNELFPENSFSLVAILANDWNADFSPWEAPAAFGKERFAGKGPEMLQWLTGVCIPLLDIQLGFGRDRYLIGYSLAGLFSLWAAYETSVFKGVACCSGSLWFQNWDKYVKEHSIAAPCDIYLSLGGKEEKTKNPIMATVGDRTREQEVRMRQDSNVRRVTLEWNSGGHFADAAKRLSKGMIWLLSDEQ